MMKIAFYDTKIYDLNSFNQLELPQDIQFKFFEAKLNQDTVDLSKGFDAVCIFVNDVVDKKVIDSLYANGVRLIALRCAGYNNVDLAYCFGKIHVVHVPAYSPHAVAEFAMGLLLTSIRRIHKAYNRTREFNFSISGLTGNELYQKTIGVIGTGKIGKAFINICQGFSMRVLAYDKYPDKSLNVEYVSLAELFKKSDYISLHCPLSDDTYHLINKDTIEQMKKGVVIVNTSRGALVDGEDLCAAIKDRKVGAACLDVYEEEADIFYTDYSNHIVNDDVLARLISLPNVLITSHQGYLTNEALAAIAETTLQSIKKFLNNEPLENELCYHCGNVENCRKTRKEKCF